MPRKTEFMTINIDPEEASIKANNGDPLEHVQDFKYLDWTSEEVYDQLYQDAEKIDIEQLGEMLDEHFEWGEGPASNGEGNDDEPERCCKRPGRLVCL